MKYIIAALAFVGLVAVAEAKPVTVNVQYFDVEVMVNKSIVNGCLSDVGNGTVVRVYISDCQSLANDTYEAIKKREPNIILQVTINGVEVNKS